MNCAVFVRHTRLADICSIDRHARRDLGERRQQFARREITHIAIGYPPAAERCAQRPHLTGEELVR